MGMLFRWNNTALRLLCSFSLLQYYAAVVIQPTANKPTRRNILLSAISSWVVAPSQSWARGLVKFPCTRPLANSYHLMRAGTSILEEEGILSTNPLFLTNREDALSTIGQEQVLAACSTMKIGTRGPTLVKYSLAARCIDTSNLVSRELRLGSDRLVPEFTFMDPRGIGAWDMSSQDAVVPALFALDYDEAGNDGIAGRPPANDDGTPHESLSDQAVRLRQILSILESQYSGETILMIFPDGTSPALLSTMMAGIPFRHVHELEYQPGEVRFDVTMDSTLQLWRQRKDSPEYWKTLDRGRSILAELRDPEKKDSPLLDLRTKKLEEERLAIDAEQAEIVNRKALATESRETIRQRQRYSNEQAENRVDPMVRFAGSVGIVALSAVAGLMNNRLEESSTSEGSAVSLSESIELQERTQTAIMEDIAANLRSKSNRSPENRVVLSIPEKEEAAAAAMDNYMNRDDGLSDWLKSLNEIINDDEETNSGHQP